MVNKTDDLRIINTQELLSPSDVIKELSPSETGIKTILESRREISRILNKKSKKFIIVVGPCSIHDIDAAKEYAIRLKQLKENLSENCLVIMRVYFEKPRTVIGWKGLINDPDLDGSFKINNGIKLARKLLIDLSEMNIPCGHEFLDLVSPQYLSDLISWGAIGARTTESQSHRELASGLSCPVGFKNGTDGSIQIAIDAMNAARHSHSFLSVTKEGRSAIFNTAGNEDCHIILRGGNKKTNYSSEDVQKSASILENNGLIPNIMIDASHANSNKDYKMQSAVVDDVKNQIIQGEKNIIGLMLESNLIEGNQKIDSKENLKYGQSITDSCIGWQETEDIILSLDESLKKTYEN
jgi:3-deoxy-7-phosphoheptulonate synthase